MCSSGNTSMDDFVTGRCEPYVDYKPMQGIVGCPHYTPLREATGLSCVRPPEVKYKLHLKRSLYTGENPGDGYISQAQIEAVVYAFQSHSQFFKAEYEPFPLTKAPAEERMLLGDVDEETDVFVVDVIRDANEPQMNVEMDQSDDDIEAMQVDELGPTEEEVIAALGPVQKNERIYRRGFLLGDGTGTGKTRILACIVSEFYLSGGRRCLWITANRELFDSIPDEFEGFLSPNFLTIKDLPNYHPTPDKIEVMQITYRDLVKIENAKLIESWLGEDYQGLMLFDEVHLAKSAYIAGKKSQTGKRIMRLQHNFPKSRVVYCTATAASEVEHLLVFFRLNIWGETTAYPDADEFKAAVGQRGLAGFELLAMEMKMAGVFVSRQMSFEGVTVRFEKVDPKAGFTCAYARATELWSLLCEYQDNLKEVYKELYEGDKDMLEELPRRVAGLYQSCQSFFGSLMTSAKIPKMDKLARAALNADKSVVIGLQRTGGTQLSRFVTTSWNSGKPFSNALSILRIAMLNLGIPLGCPRTYLRNGAEVRIGRWTNADCTSYDSLAYHCKWPVQVITEVLQRREYGHGSFELDGFGRGAEMPDAWPNYSVGSYIFHPSLKSPRSINWSMSQFRENPSLAGFARLYHELALLLPINPLDEIRNRLENPIQRGAQGSNPRTVPETSVDYLKKYDVGELTGRDYYYMYNHVEHKWEYVKRKYSVRDEMNRFTNWQQRVVVVSNTASTGFNLHSDVKKPNIQQRVHITMEVGWAPELLLQQLGRTHRSGQKHPPMYFILGTSIRGEQRYMSIMGRRLRFSGAVCQGHSEANPHSGFLRDDLFSENSIPAINDALEEVERAHPRIQRVVEMLDITMISTGSTSVGLTRSKRDATSKFLNRLMAMPLNIQEELCEIIEKKLAEMDDEESFYKSMKALPANLENVKCKEMCDLMVANKPAKMHWFKVERYATWECVLDLKSKHESLCFYKLRENSHDHVVAVYECSQQRKKKVIRPFNRNVETIKETEEMAGWEQIGQDVAEAEWRREVEQMKDEANCEHQRLTKTPCKRLKQSRTCTYRWATTECLVVSGQMSEVAELLENRMSIPTQMGIVSWSDAGTPRSTAGLLVSYENCRYPIKEVFGVIESNYKLGSAM